MSFPNGYHLLRYRQYDVHRLVYLHDGTFSDFVNENVSQGTKRNQRRPLLPWYIANTGCCGLCNILWAPVDQDWFKYLSWNVKDNSKVNVNNNLISAKLEFYHYRIKICRSKILLNITNWDINLAHYFNIFFY